MGEGREHVLRHDDGNTLVVESLVTARVRVRVRVRARVRVRVRARA